MTGDTPIRTMVIGCGTRLRATDTITGVVPGGTDPYNSFSSSIRTQNVSQLKLAEAKRYAPVRHGNNKAHQTKADRKQKAKMVKQSKKRNRK